MSTPIFYDGTKLLNKKDLNGKEPENVFCVGNRTAGKTFFFSKYIFDNFLINDEKFLLIYRNNYELYEVSEKFFGDLQENVYPGIIMFQKTLVKDKIMNLYIEFTETGEQKHCGYAVSLNSFNVVKKYSHFLNDTKIMFFDEFQSEDNYYLTDELKKFLSIHTSLARDYGKQRRFLKTIFVSNAVSLINPYFAATDIPERLRNNTKFLRGKGYVLEFCKINIEGIEDSGVYQTFDSDYLKYATDNVYLNDDVTNIQKRPNERNKYLCSFLYKNKEYAIRKYADCIYVDNSVDKSNPLKFAAENKNIKNGYISKSLKPETINYLRTYYYNNNFRFKNLESKVALIRFLCYN